MYSHRLALKWLLPLTVLWLALAGCALVRDQPMTVIAQVSTRPVVGEDLSDKERIAVRFTLNTPAKLRGAEFYLVTSSTQKAEVEKQFPFHGVWEIRLNRPVIQELKRQIASRKSIERQTKAGIDPMMISQTYTIPLIRSEALTAEPMDQCGSRSTSLPSH